jgi:hypothetical protein
MRFGWSGWRSWPPWLVGYLGILLIAGSAMVLLLGVGSCTGALGRGFTDLGETATAGLAIGLGVLMMVAGVRMISAPLDDGD